MQSNPNNHWNYSKIGADNYEDDVSSVNNIFVPYSEKDHQLTKKNKLASTIVPEPRSFRTYIAGICILLFILFTSIAITRHSFNSSSDVSDTVNDTTDDDNSTPYYSTANNDDNDNKENDDSNSIAYSEKGSLDFTFSRVNYEPLSFFTSEKSEIIKYNFLEDYVAVIEPYVDMEFYIEDDSSSSKYYKISVCEYDADTNTYTNDCSTGSHSSDSSFTVNLECNPYDEYAIIVESYKSTKSGYVYEDVTSRLGVCLYVRREIRTLTDDDLQAAIEAMYTMWSTDLEEGITLYGDNFKSSTYFVECHMFNAGQRDSDHFHEGQGFLPQHTKLSNLFEKSMQSVDPSVSLFYWDTTYDNYYSITLADNPMFQDDTFGSITDADGDGWDWSQSGMKYAKIPDGKWKHQKADLNKKYDDLGNSFGYMRGPWNFNPSPFLSRFASSSAQGMPGCSDYINQLQYDSYSSYLYSCAYAPHASIHAILGNIYGCELLEPLLDAGMIKDETSMNTICAKWGFKMKEWYRANAISRPDPDTGGCDAGDLSYDGVKCYVNCTSDTDYLNDLMEEHIGSQYVPSGFTDWSLWTDFVCNGDGYKIFQGDHLEAASPADPSFWPIHPNGERLFQLKLMVGGFADSTWVTSAKQACNKNTCFEVEDYGNVKGSYDSCCYGHFVDDQMLDFITADTHSYIGETNSEIMAAIDPTSDDYAVNYIYDDLSWSHCESHSYSMSDTIETCYNNGPGTCTGSTDDDISTLNDDFDDSVFRL